MRGEVSRTAGVGGNSRTNGEEQGRAGGDVIWYHHLTTRPTSRDSRRTGDNDSDDREDTGNAYDDEKKTNDTAGRAVPGFSVADGVDKQPGPPERGLGTMKRYVLSYYAVLISARFSNVRRDTWRGSPARRGSSCKASLALDPAPSPPIQSHTRGSQRPYRYRFASQGFARGRRHVTHYWPSLSTAQLAAVYLDRRLQAGGCKHGPVRSPAPQRSLYTPAKELTGRRKPRRCVWRSRPTVMCRPRGIRPVCGQTKRLLPTAPPACSCWPYSIV